MEAQHFANRRCIILAGKRSRRLCSARPLTGFPARWPLNNGYASLSFVDKLIQSRCVALETTTLNEEVARSKAVRTRQAHQALTLQGWRLGQRHRPSWANDHRMGSWTNSHKQ